MKSCPACREFVQPDASVCRHCGHRFTPEEMAAGRREARASYWFRFLLIALVAALVISWLANGGAERLGEALGAASVPDGGN